IPALPTRFMPKASSKNFAAFSGSETDRAIWRSRAAMGLSSRFWHQHLSAAAVRQAPAIRFAPAFRSSSLRTYSDCFALSCSCFQRLFDQSTQSRKNCKSKDLPKAVPIAALLYLGELERRRMKQLRSGELAIDQALFVKVLRQCLDFRHVFRHAISPEITPHQRAGLVGFSFKPRQTNRQRIDVAQVRHGERLGFAKRLIDARRQPGIFFGKRFADADQVHDRK